MLRAIDIKRLVLELLRPNYAISNGVTVNGEYNPPKLNTIYKFIFSLVYPLYSSLEQWDKERRRSYAIAACQYGRMQVLAILNYYYGQFGPITSNSDNDDVLYLYAEDDPEATDTYLYAEGGTPVYLYKEGSFLGTTIIYIPAALATSDSYSDFVADLNSMILYGIQVTIKQIQ